MYITILTIGSHGDIRPYVALGRGLKQAGYQIQIATHGHYQPLISRYGLDFVDVGGDPRQILASAEGQAWVESGQNVLRFIQQQLRVGQKIMRPILDQSWLACQNTDAIIFSVFGTPGYHIAEKLNVPCIAAWLQPLSPTTAFASPAMPPMWQFGATYNWATHIGAALLAWLPFSRTFNQWRTQTLGLPPLGLAGPYRAFRQKKVPIIYGYSPTVIPKPHDWPDQLTIAGYWFLDRDDDWQPPASLVDFLQAGSPPVYIGFGSMPSRDPAALLELAIGGLKQAGKRGVLLGGWSGLNLEGELSYLTDDIVIIESVPHDWLFPKMAALVHHGGAGTTAAGLRAGIPSIVIPFFADQPFWGYRLAQLGVGPQPIMRRDLTVQKLAKAIQQATNDKHMRCCAAKIGRSIRAENGVARAVEVVQAYLGSRKNLADY